MGLTVRFEADKSISEPGVVVNFTNTSGLSGNFLWDFGDGTTSIEENPSHTFDTVGRFQVTLTIENDNGTGSQFTEILVGNRYAISFFVSSVALTNGQADWEDDGTGPDVVFGFIPNGATSGTFYTVQNDLTANDLPIFALIPEAGQARLTNETWTFIFIENDTEDPFSSLPDESLIGDPIMYSVEANPTTIGETDYSIGLGAFSFSDGEFEFQMEYEIREQ